MIASGYNIKYFSPYIQQLLVSSQDEISWLREYQASQEGLCAKELVMFKTFFINSFVCGKYLDKHIASYI
jgi:hypothetical protein